MTSPEPQPAAPAALDPVPGEWQRVSPKYLTVELLTCLVSAIVASGLLVAPFVATGEPLFLLIPAAMFLCHVALAIFIPRRVRALGYRLREDDLVFRKGIMFQRIVAVPYGRMQLVDITRGPIARAFGLAELKLVTAAAASHVSIPGLAEADADALRDRLVELAESRRAGL